MLVRLKEKGNWNEVTSIFGKATKFVSAIVRVEENEAQVM